MSFMDVSGDTAKVTYSINSTGFSPVSLYLFLDEDWQEARETNGCFRKLSMARLVRECLYKLINIQQTI